jgi:UDP-glucose 4-epimerase
VPGVDFKVEFTGRRAGDPALKWQPYFEDLQTIVSHALTWQRKLFAQPI